MITQMCAKCDEGEEQGVVRENEEGSTLDWGVKLLRPKG